MDNNEFSPHPHSHIWMWVTVVIVILGIILVSYYLIQSRRTVSPKQAKQQTEIASLPTPQEITAPPSPVVISKDTAPKTVAAEVKQINVKAIQQSVKELQAAIAAFKQ